MTYLFDEIWTIFLFILGAINQLVGFLLDIKFLDVPILVYLVFFDLFLSLIQLFVGDKLGIVDDDDDDELSDEEIPLPQGLKRTMTLKELNNYMIEEEGDNDDD